MSSDADRTIGRSRPFFSDAMTYRERARLLEQCQWGKELSWAQMENIARRLKTFEVKAGETIFREGDREPYLCLLVRGRVRIIKHDSKGRGADISEVLPGQPFGEMSLIDNEPRSASAEAKTNILALAMDQADFEALSKEAPSLALKMVLNVARLMSARLRVTSGELAEHLAHESLD